MRFMIKAACGCNTGKRRKNNEDNFYFDGKCLEADNSGLEKTIYIETKSCPGVFHAVFDGVGGEVFGEYASYAAAQGLKQIKKNILKFVMPERKNVEKMVYVLNDAVCKVKEELCAENMGTTMVALFYSFRHVHICNIGDSRAYLLRNGKLKQLSIDHVASCPMLENKKAPITQYLGIDTKEMLLDPYVIKEDLEKGDAFLLCSDGLTDMLTDDEIKSVLLHENDVVICVNKLIQKAIECGGRDNITVILSIIN